MEYEYENSNHLNSFKMKYGQHIVKQKNHQFSHAIYLSIIVSTTTTT